MSVVDDLVTHQGATAIPPLRVEEVHQPRTEGKPYADSTGQAGGIAVLIKETRNAAAARVTALTPGAAASTSASAGHISASICTLSGHRVMHSHNSQGAGVVPGERAVLRTSYAPWSRSCRSVRMRE